jgi:hypothetical protein
MAGYGEDMQETEVASRAVDLSSIDDLTRREERSSEAAED